MTTNESQNEKQADRAEPATTEVDATTVQPAVPETVTPAPAQPAAPAVVDLRRPSWLTKTVAAAGGVAAATFVLGGAVGYAIGHAGGDDTTRGFNGPPGFSQTDDGQRGFSGPNGQPGQGNQQMPGNSSGSKG